MKFFIALFFCLFIVLNISAQTESETKSDAVGVDEIILFKDDGEGKRGDETESFLISDKPLHCQILLDSEKSATVKMEMIVVEVKGMKVGAKTVVVSYKTNGKQNVVNFSFNPQTVWNAGKYKIVVLINGKLSASKDFEIINTSEVKWQK